MTSVFSELRKESLDVYNRLHSIAQDVQFVKEVRAAYPSLPIFPNLRCGAWYTDPALVTESADAPGAYFKSTDGHFGNWSFNLRRPNLHLLPLISKYNGIIIVDSTRSGKRIPDALSKTLPIWCAVVNTAIRLRHTSSFEGHDDWDCALYTPPGVVSPQEHQQIAKRIAGWARALNDSSYTLPRLKYPLRPLWITPATTTFPPLPQIDDEQQSPHQSVFIPVICISASVFTSSEMNRRESGYTYIQGSGDDHELWGMGLTPNLFWNHQQELLDCPRHSLENLIHALVAADLQRSHELLVPAADRHSISEHHPLILQAHFSERKKRIPQTSGMIGFCDVESSNHSPSANYVPQNGDGSSHSYILVSSDVKETLISETPGLEYLILPLSSQRTTLHQIILPSALAFIENQLPAGRVVYFIFETSDTGRPATDLTICLLLASLSRYFGDDNGEFGPLTGTSLDVDKKFIRKRLEWIVENRPASNPPRVLLKRLNEFLLTPKAFLPWAEAPRVENI